jgi:N-acetylmuramoyl-L-alanine amidase
MIVVGIVATAVLALGGLGRLSPTPTLPTASGAPGSPEAAGTAVDPTLFAAGSCVAFAPTRGDRHLTVFLDAGHGGIDPGALGTTETGRVVDEARETLPVELDTMALLRSAGYRVVVSRTRASTVVRLRPGDIARGVLTIAGDHRDLTARDVCADLAHASVLVGIYFDAAASRRSAGSITAYDAVRPFHAASHRLAVLVQRNVLKRLNRRGYGIPDDGVQTDVRLGGVPLNAAAAAYDHLLLLGPAKAGYFSTPSTMPGALIEPLFITDPFEGTLAAEPGVQALIAHGLAAAVEQYFGR